MGRLIVVGVIVALLGILGERLINIRSKLFADRVMEPVELANCHLIKGLEYGSEDILILPNGLAFISSGLKFPGIQSFAPDRPAEIFLLDLSEENPMPVVLQLSHGFDLASFNPHGMSVHIDETDNIVYLFVVNHPQFATTVEIFKFVGDENSLVHLKTITHDLFSSVNDVLALGPDSFYATIDYYFSNPILRVAEQILRLPWSSVVYYSPTEVKEVATGFHSTNGISISPDKKYVYIADVFGSTIHVMEMHDNKTLTPVKILELETLPDNLDVDPDTGDVWAGCHPNGWKLFLYDPENPPGSEVIRIQNILSDEPVVTQVYVNNGSVLQGSSVASVYEGKLLVGTVFHKTLYCDLNEPEVDTD